MEVLELTRKLGAAIQKDEAYIKYQLAKDNNDKDEALQKDIGEFNLLRVSLNNELSKQDVNEDKKKELNAQLQELYGKIMTNENMIQFNQAKQAMDNLVSKVNSILIMCVNGEDPATCEPSDCTGSCSSCSGCH